MPTATWYEYNHGTIDGQLAQGSIVQVNVGIIISGGSKAGKRRCIFGFDLSKPPAEGAAPGPGAQIVNAEILLDITQLDGAGAWTMRIERITRLDWYGYPKTTWETYDGVNPWTTPGGDAGPPPAFVDLASPLALGAYAAGGLQAFVTDAPQRNNLVILRAAALNENPSLSTHFGAAWEAASPLRPRLRVTTQAAAVIDDPRLSTMPGDRPAAASRPAGVTRPAGGARPAKGARP